MQRDIIAKRHYRKETLLQRDIIAKRHYCKETLSQRDIIAKRHYRKEILSQRDIIAKRHYRKETLSQRDIIAKRNDWNLCGSLMQFASVLVDYQRKGPLCTPTSLGIYLAENLMDYFAKTSGTKMMELRALAETLFTHGTSDEMSAHKCKEICTYEIRPTQVKETVKHEKRRTYLKRDLHTCEM